MASLELFFSLQPAPSARRRWSFPPTHRRLLRWHQLTIARCQFSVAGSNLIGWQCLVPLVLLWAACIVIKVNRKREQFVEGFRKLMQFPWNSPSLGGTRSYHSVPFWGASFGFGVNMYRVNHGGGNWLPGNYRCNLGVNSYFPPICNYVILLQYIVPISIELIKDV